MATRPVERSGMALRDYFAAAAVTGLLANPGTTSNIQGICEDSYDIADIMLGERQRKRPL